MSPKVRDIYPRRFLIGFFTVVALGLIGGGEVMRWGIRSKTSQLQDEIIAEAIAVAREVNVARVLALSFSKRDLDLVEYQRLCLHLQSYARFSGGHSLFMVVERDGAFVIGPGNLKGADGLFVPPGTIYANPPPELADVVRTRQPNVSRPATDTLGRKVVSAWIPIMRPGSDDVLVVVGFMVSAEGWNAHFVRLWWGAGLFSLSLVACMLMAFYLAGKSRNIPAGMERMVGLAEVCLVLLTGMIFTLTLCRMTRNLERYSRWTNFQDYARSQSRDVSRSLSGLRTRVDALALLLSGEDKIRADTFMRYLPPVSQFGFAENWAWVPVVPVTKIVAFESGVRNSDEPSFAVWQLDEHGARVPVLWRDLYYPILYCESYSNQASLVGFDCGSDSRLREALDTCVRSGLVTGTTPIRPFGTGEVKPDLYVFQPVYSNKGGWSELRGVVLVVVDLGRLLQYAVTPVGANVRRYVSADLCELSLTDPPRVLVSSAAGARPANQSRLLKADNYRLNFTAPLFYFGKAYAVTVRAESAYFEAHPIRLARVTGLVGGILTFLLAAFVGLLANRRTDLEHEISARTSELAQVNQQVTTILDSVGDGIISVDHEGLCTVVNASAEQALGYEAAELLKKPCDVIWMSPSSRSDETPRGVCPVYATYMYGTTCTMDDTVFYRKNGTSFHVALVCKPISVQGKVVGAVITFEDVTERRIAEENLHHVNSELANVNSQLREASQAKNQFLAHMSHEIRTPLNCVIGMSGLLMNTELDEEQQDFAETIRISGESLLSIVNEILDFSKIEAQRLELEKQPFDLRHCVEDAVDLVAPAAVAKRLELLYMIDDSLPKTFIGDVTRLRQILVNLLSNAVKFTERGEVEVTVCGQMTGKQMTLDFSVRDTGLGIPPDQQANLFESFHQCDASTTRRFGGTGLGLAISKRLAELMGGSMRVESSGVAGCGTTFYFSVQMEPDGSVRDRDVTPYTLAAGKRVLIAVSNKAGREVLARQVRALAMNPVTVASGHEALDLLGHGDLFGQSEPFDLAILETRVDSLCGMELGNALRAVHGYEQLRLILLEPLGEHVHKDESLRLVERLAKPIKLAPLYEAVGRLFALETALTRKTGLQHVHLDGELGRQNPLRILIAEDNVVNQKVAASILRKLGYRADLVSNGSEALEAVKSTDYDLVLMDVQMPEMDGEDAARLIRRDVPARRQPWIVAMTANVMKEDRDRYRAAGMNDYIPKPVRIEHLVNVLLSVQPLSVRTGLDALMDRTTV